MGKVLGAAAALFAGLGFGMPAAAQMAEAGTWDTGSAPCQQVVGQAEIDGTQQQVVGLACLQPDGTWQVVDTSGGAVAYPAPAYYVDPWYWAPVGVGFGASFIFVDRFHHFHHMHRVFMPRAGVAGGFRGGFRGAPHGSFHGMEHGGFHGGGMHHR